MSDDDEFLVDQNISKANEAGDFVNDGNLLADEFEESSFGIEDSEDDIGTLEDREERLLGEGLVISEENLSLSQDTPIYRLRLVYSKETFHAAWAGETLEPGTRVLVPTRYGRDLAEIIDVTPVKAGQIPQIVTRIERVANAEDIGRAAFHEEQETEAFDICKKKILAHKLDMKLVSVHYLLEEPKILFFFTAESRVDFRELVKDLVSIFKTRIELRQIGVRDESRVLGGLGVCGRAYCCHAVSDKLKPVSIKMAKDQNLSLNSMKISGPCGRLLCCLAYEYLFYGEQRRLIPNEGTRLHWEGGSWKVIEVNVVMGKLKLANDDGRITQLPMCAFEKVDNHWVIKHCNT
jgi:cell fate regulator YaaT (PSP1 superfamily)